MDFDGNIVALRCPLGGLSYFEAGADQINAELALKKKTHTQQLFNQEVQAHSYLQRRSVALTPLVV